MQQEASSKQADTGQMSQEQLLAKVSEMMLEGTLKSPEEMEAALNKVARRLRMEEQGPDEGEDLTNEDQLILARNLARSRRQQTGSQPEQQGSTESGTKPSSMPSNLE